MAAPQPPEHSGLRPLGPYGEGYCRVCHFIIGLTANGLIERHTRGGQFAPTECKGGFKKAPKLIPTTSKLAAFKTKAGLVLCPVCTQMVPLLADGRMNGHVVAAGPPTYCKGGYNFPNFRDHGGERG